MWQGCGNSSRSSLTTDVSDTGKRDGQLDWQGPGNDQRRRVLENLLQASVVASSAEAQVPGSSQTATAPTCVGSEKSDRSWPLVKKPGIKGLGKNFAINPALEN
jgi:hypothetical protein